MKIFVNKDIDTLGENAAQFLADMLNDCISKKGSARLLLSTGASQLSTIKALVTKKVDWSCVEMFHLDEYVDLPITHIASFRKYLKERFVDIVHPKNAYFVDGTPDCISKLTKEIKKSPIDIGVIGIGENAHIAFNDPPADFDTKESYIIVNLDNACKNQQVGEGWFATVNDVPKQAVSMTVSQIMQCEHIVSCVPNAVKANAIVKTLSNEVTNLIPATIMKTHSDFTLFVDENSYSLVDENKINSLGNECKIEKI